MATEQVSPNKANYMRGGTRVVVKRSTDSGYINLGNIVACTIARVEDISEHLSGYTGAKVIDRKRVQVKSIDYTIQSDENTTENLRSWLLGGTLSAVTRAATVCTDTTIQMLCVGHPTVLVKGRWYDMKILAAAGGAWDKEWDPAFPLTISGYTENSTFFHDYTSGRIMFPAGVASTTGAGTVSGGKLRLLTGISNSFSVAGSFFWDVIAEGVYIFENNTIRDFWTVPKAQLIPSGDGAISIENDRVLEFKLTQLKHTTLNWGTYERADVGA